MFLIKRVAVSILLLICSLTFVSCNNKDGSTTNKTNEAGTDNLLAFTGSEMDLIMWYDIDNGSLINARPDKGWWKLNPEYPADPVDKQQYRTTTSLLGKYESQDPKVIKQHAYWIKALGCNVIASDLTNSISARLPNKNPGQIAFYRNVNKAFELQLKYLAEINEFDAPSAYPTIRLNGEKYDDLKLMLDDMYILYEKYPTKWYKLDDGTESKVKPFIVIFADGALLKQWVTQGIPLNDDRFNIRWSNGFLVAQEGVTQLDSNKNRKIAGNMPYWLFVENTKNINKNGYYEPIYKLMPDGRRVEQMITWASVNLGGRNWDGLLDEIDGKKPIERYTEPVYSIRPKALLVNRFNYPMGWGNEPQEGISRNKSTHMEPNVDWGFLVFNNVANELYKVRGYEKKSPEIPALNSFDKEKNLLSIKLDNYPLEYRISNNEDLSGSEWTFLNVGTGGIKINSKIDITKKLYIQSRNSFGESLIGDLTLS